MPVTFLRCLKVSELSLKEAFPNAFRFGEGLLLVEVSMTFFCAEALVEERSIATSAQP